MGSRSHINKDRVESYRALVPVPEDSDTGEALEGRYQLGVAVVIQVADGQKPGSEFHREGDGLRQEGAAGIVED